MITFMIILNNYLKQYLLNTYIKSTCALFMTEKSTVFKFYQNAAKNVTNLIIQYKFE